MRKNEFRNEIYCILNFNINFEFFSCNCTEWSEHFYNSCLLANIFLIGKIMRKEVNLDKSSHEGYQYLQKTSCNIFLHPIFLLFF